ncbi:MAG: GDSL-type esterase/lipase family protein [Myxococcota bacterium]
MRNEEVRILFVGASIIEGWRSVATDVWTNVLEPAGALNLGIPGETSGQLMWRVQNGFLRGLRPDVVVLQVGANDRQVKAEHVAENIADVVREMRKQIPRARIILFSIFPTDRAGSPLRRKNEQTNALLNALAGGEAVRVVDCGNLFVDENGETRPELLPDGLHLSREAYALWAGVLFPLLGLTSS